MLTDRVRRHFVNHPDELVAMVKELRAFVDSPRADPTARREAQAILRRYGYDDESLKREDVDD